MAADTFHSVSGFKSRSPRSSHDHYPLLLYHRLCPKLPMPPRLLQVSEPQPLTEMISKDSFKSFDSRWVTPLSAPHQPQRSRWPRQCETSPQWLAQLSNSLSNPPPVLGTFLARSWESCLCAQPQILDTHGLSWLA